ncbi:MAG: ferritin-like domain-containing protein [Oscillospiraceae bacterium]|nr:ferritin-like domain-containing protein [Oscillospiraceae bacterium]
MDNNSIFLTQRKFDEVWGRVTGSPRADTDILKTLMNYEYTDWNIYRTLSQRYTGENKIRFTEMANDERRHFRMLHGAYYILTGEKYVPEKPEKLSSGTLPQILKERYKIELEAAAGYLKAAETAPSDLADLYLSNAEDEKRHAKTALYLLSGVVK